MNYFRSCLKFLELDNKRNGDVIAQQYAGSEAFHKAQIDKVGEDWKAVRHNIALIAVKRYLSNVLTDYEKQKTFSLFLGEFKPDPARLEASLWNEDATIPFAQSQADITEEKIALFPLITKQQKMVQPSFGILNEKNAFDDEKITVLGGENSISRENPRNKKESFVMGEANHKENSEKSDEEKNNSILPSNFHFLESFKKMEREYPLIKESNDKHK